LPSPIWKYSKKNETIVENLVTHHKGVE